MFTRMKLTRLGRGSRPRSAGPGEIVQLFSDDAGATSPDDLRSPAGTLPPRRRWSRWTREFGPGSGFLPGVGLVTPKPSRRPGTPKDLVRDLITNRNSRCGAYWPRSAPGRESSMKASSTRRKISALFAPVRQIDHLIPVRSLPVGLLGLQTNESFGLREARRRVRRQAVPADVYAPFNHSTGQRGIGSSYSPKVGVGMRATVALPRVSIRRTAGSALRSRFRELCNPCPTFTNLPAARRKSGIVIVRVMADSAPALPDTSSSEGGEPSGLILAEKVQRLRTESRPRFLHLATVLAFSCCRKALPYPVYHEFRGHLMLRHFKLVDRNPALTIVTRPYATPFYSCILLLE